MLDKLGPLGIVGLLALFAGIVLVAWENLVIGVGLALVIAGLGLAVSSAIKTMLSSMGMGGMM